MIFAKKAKFSLQNLTSPFEIVLPETNFSQYAVMMLENEWEKLPDKMFTSHLSELAKKTFMLMVVV